MNFGSWQSHSYNIILGFRIGPYHRAKFIPWHQNYSYLSYFILDRSRESRHVVVALPPEESRASQEDDQNLNILACGKN